MGKWKYFMWVPINSGNRSGSCSENCGFRMEFRIPRIEFRIPRAAPRIPRNSPRAPRMAFSLRERFSWNWGGSQGSDRLSRDRRQDPCERERERQRERERERERKREREREREKEAERERERYRERILRRGLPSCAWITWHGSIPWYPKTLHAQIGQCQTPPSPDATLAFEFVV